MEPLSTEIEATLERLRKAPDSSLPQSVVGPLLAMRDQTEEELRRLIVNAAVALAVKVDGTATPGAVLRIAADTAPVRGWDERIKPEVKRLWAASHSS